MLRHISHIPLFKTQLRHKLIVMIWTLNTLKLCQRTFNCQLQGYKYMYVYQKNQIVIAKEITLHAHDVI